jgi:hypothetical protein
MVALRSAAALILILEGMFFAWGLLVIAILVAGGFGEELETMDLPSSSSEQIRDSLVTTAFLAPYFGFPAFFAAALGILRPPFLARGTGKGFAGLLVGSVSAVHVVWGVGIAAIGVDEAGSAADFVGHLITGAILAVLGATFLALHLWPARSPGQEGINAH